MPDNTRLEIALRSALGYLSIALEILNSGDLKDSDVHRETFQAHASTMEALRREEVRRQPKKPVPVLEMPDHCWRR